MNESTSPNPDTIRQPSMAPYGEYHDEDITLENGERVTIRRHHARNGQIEVIRHAR